MLKSLQKRLITPKKHQNWNRSNFVIMNKAKKYNKPYKTVIEPFRIKMVEPINTTLTREDRLNILQEAGNNLFKIPSKYVLLDFLTDSGTGAMSTEQWSGLMRGDESYAGSPSFERFHDSVNKLFPFKHILPVHQGRAAEKILFSVLGGKNKIIPNNTHFDTTRAHIEATGATALDLVYSYSSDENLPFKGNMNINRLQSLLFKNAKNVSCIMITITNNSAGGQPVSLENILEVSKIARKYNIPLILDGCRFAENAWFIQQRESGMQNESITSIVNKIANLCDGMTMSAKKDTFANIGGWLALNDDKLARACREQLILTEGFLTYGGLAGRDLEAIAIGLEEIVDSSYLEYRIKSTEFFGKRLKQIGIPIVEPIGGHAVYIDAGRMLPNIPSYQFPGHAIATALYVEGGIRACEIGSLMFETNAKKELVRMAVPRRMYTQSHIEYAIEVCERVKELAEKNKLSGYKIIDAPPSLRHFSCILESL